MISMNSEMNRTHSADLHRHAADHRRTGKAGFARRNRPAADAGERSRSAMSIRRLDAQGADREALERLAGRDSSLVPSGEILGAVLDGRLLAAMSLTDGAIVADPFEPT